MKMIRLYQFQYKPRNVANIRGRRMILKTINFEAPYAKCSCCIIYEVGKHNEKQLRAAGLKAFEKMEQKMLKELGYIPHLMELGVTETPEKKAEPAPAPQLPPPSKHKGVNGA